VARDTAANATARELLRTAYDGFGLSQRDVQRITGITGRMQRHVLAGKGGASYLPALSELAERGRVSTPAPQRVQRVRTATGVTEEPRKPPERRPAAHGRYGRTESVTAGGQGRVVAVTMPHTPGPQRGRAAVDLAHDIDRAAGAGRYVTLNVTLRLPSGEIVTSRRAAHGQSAKSLARAITREARANGYDARTTEGKAAGVLGAIGAMFAQKSAGVLGANIIGVEIEYADSAADLTPA